jgi:exosortase E/protease (VPEID-CTERM system)
MVAVGSLRGRLCLVAAILLVEYLIVSLLFDAKTVTARGGIWSFAGSLGILAPLGLVLGTALLLLIPRNAFGAPAGTAKAFVVPAPNKFWLLLHGALFPFFLFTSQRAFGLAQSTTAWLMVWALVGLAMTSALVAGLVPFRRIVAQIPLKILFTALLIGVLAYVGGRLATDLWYSLGDLTMVAVIRLMLPVVSGFGYDLPDRILALGSFAVHIAPECAGEEGIGLSAVLMSGYLLWSRARLRFPNAFALIAIAVLLAWVGNVFRIIVLMLIGAYVSAEVALEAFHSKAGWILFCGTTLGLVWWARQSPFFSRDTAPRQEWINPTAPYLMPLVVTLVVAMISTAFASGGYDSLYGLRVAAGVLILYRYRYAWREFEFAVTWQPVLLGLGVAILWLLTAGEPKAMPSDLQTLSVASVCWWTVRAIGSAGIVPICEELAFRGFLLRRLQSRAFETVAYAKVGVIPIVLSSVAFGILHGDRWIAATLAGAAYALLLKRTGRLFDCVIAHAVTNGVIVLYSVYFHDWQHLGQ